MANDRGSIKVDTSSIYSKLEVRSRNIIDEFVKPNVVAKVNKEIIEAAEKFGQTVQETIIKPKVPKKSGKLRNSIRVIVVKSVQKNIIFRIYAGYPAAKTVPYAAYLELGTKAHTIKSKKTIHFVGYQKFRRPIKGRGKFNTKKITDVYVAGKGTSAAVIKVRGIKKIQFLKAGANYILRNFPEIVAQNLRGTKLCDSATADLT